MLGSQTNPINVINFLHGFPFSVALELLRVFAGSTVN